MSTVDCGLIFGMRYKCLDLVWNALPLWNDFLLSVSTVDEGISVSTGLSSV